MVGPYRKMDMSIADSKIPPWLDRFLVSGYFEACGRHDHGRSHKSPAEAAISTCKKGEKNFYCIDCKRGPHCSTEREEEHADHRILQVRRASKEDAVKVEDIEVLLDVRGIQEYSINSARILFLPSRPQAKVTKSGAAKCIYCARSLTNAVQFCSLNCKMVHILHNLNTTTFTMRLPSGMDHESDDGLPALTEAGADSGSPTRSPKKRVRTSSKAVSSMKNSFLPVMGTEAREIFGNALDLAKGHELNFEDKRNASGGSPTTVLHDVDRLDGSASDFSTCDGSDGILKSGDGRPMSSDGVRQTQSHNYRKRARKTEPCRAAGFGIQEDFRPPTLYFSYITA